MFLFQLVIPDLYSHSFLYVSLSLLMIVGFSAVLLLMMAGLFLRMYSSKSSVSEVTREKVYKTMKDILTHL